MSPFYSENHSLCMYLHIFTGWTVGGAATSGMADTRIHVSQQYTNIINGLYVCVQQGLCLWFQTVDRSKPSWLAVSLHHII